jgi:(1->4)-alpha-D-glucan 1-alpha-D-glucosylmutase
MRREERKRFAGELLSEWRDGRIKLYVTHVALQLRLQREGLMRTGAYVPIQPTGQRAQHLFAFARSGESDGGSVVVVVPRLSRMLEKAAGTDLTNRSAWGDTRVSLEGLATGAGRGWKNLVTNAILPGGVAPAGKLFDGFPVALLESV